MKFNEYTQVRRPRTANPTTAPSRKRVVYLGSPAKEPRIVEELRKAHTDAPRFKTPKGVFTVSVN